MKIAIQGHHTRGHEVIQILESLGGKNLKKWQGTGDIRDGFFIDNDGIIKFDNLPKGYKLYTLEEFKKEFPFKVGDEVITTYGSVGIIRTLTPENDEIPYCIETEKGYIYRHQSDLKPYKEMERNITLTFEKAQEWYKKGGELKEIALQAFTKKELTKVDLPKTWEEFCDNYMIDDSEAYFDTCSEVCIANKTCRHSLFDRNICPSKKSAEAHLALIQLEQLRDCWRQEWKPTSEKAVYAIKVCNGKLDVFHYFTREFLSFPTREMAEEFLKCFRDLIEQAGDLI